jgi:Ca-activated chloride channel family protein
VQADFAANRTAEVKDKAIELIDAGRQDEAAKLLRSNAGYFDDYGKRYKNDSVLGLSVQNTAEAEEVQLSLFTVESRKKYRAANANTYNQQTIFSSNFQINNTGTVNQQDTSSSSVAPMRKKK